MPPQHEPASTASRQAFGWAGLPAKRRRFNIAFAVWIAIAAFTLGPLIGVRLPAAGTGPVLISIAVIALGAALLVPTGRAAWKERQQRITHGDESAYPPISGAAMVGWLAGAVCSWAAAGAVIVYFGEPMLPLMPVLITVLAIIRFRQWRHTSAGVAAQR